MLPDPRLTFDNLVVGPGNRLAVAAMRRAAESPGTNYNPLVIEGGPGTGKTHLLSAVGHLTLAVRPDLEVTYETAESYVDRLAGEVASGTYHFREEHLGLGMLLLDDIEFLAEKGQTQTELLWIWEALVAAGSQVILASGRPLAEVDGLDQRLISRFSGGLILDITAPELETRTAILQRWATERNATLGTGVADAIARLSPGSARELSQRLERLLDIQKQESRQVAAEEVFSLFGADPPLPKGEDEFSSFLYDVSSTVAEVVESEPWRQALAREILRWEGEGIRTQRLEQALEGDASPDVDAMIAAFATDVARLRDIERELREFDPRAVGTSLLRDPDRLSDAERLLAAARPRPRAPSARRVAAPHASYGNGAPDAGEDRWFFNRETLAWSWIGLDDRLLEELG